MIHDPKKTIRDGQTIVVAQIIIWSYIFYLIIEELCY